MTVPSQETVESIRIGIPYIVNVKRKRIVCPEIVEKILIFNGILRHVDVKRKGIVSQLIVEPILILFLIQ